MKSNSFAQAKSQVSFKLTTTANAHHLVPGHIKNQSNTIAREFVKSFSEQFQLFPYYSDLPKPLLPPSKLQRDSICEDPSMQIVNTKIGIQSEINRYLGFYKKSASKLDKNKNDCITKLPKYVAKVTKILDCDPNPSFSGSYNWYYNGGTLNGISHDSKNLLIFPFANELIALPLDAKEYSSLLPNYEKATKIPISDNLFQVVCDVVNNSGRILTRHKNNCSLYNIFNLNKNKLEFMKISNETSEVPYISVDLDPLDVNRYCSVNIDRKICIWDITTCKKTIKETKLFSTLQLSMTKYIEDNWAFLKYHDFNNNILKYTDRHCVTYYDIRLPFNEPCLKMCPKDSLENCEYISAYAASIKSEFYSYIGSNHNICLLDTRCPDKPITKKWTHQFKSSPLITDVCFRGDSEFVVMASQIAGETGILLNTWSSVENPPDSSSTPFSPPTNMETLTALQSQGKCLDPYFKKRLSLCNTGCMIVIDDHTQDIYLFIQNSINDIFYQGISHHEPLNLYSLENCKSLHKLKLWENQIHKNSFHDIHSPLVVTKKLSTHDTFSNLINKKIKTPKVLNAEKTLDYVPTWQRTMAELECFVDILAPELMARWDIMQESSSVSVKNAPHQKVLSWLQNQVKSVPTEIDIPASSFDTLVKQETLTQQDAEILGSYNDEEIELFLPRVKSQSTRNPKKNNKRFNVPGF